MTNVKPEAGNVQDRAGTPIISVSEVTEAHTTGLRSQLKRVPLVKVGTIGLQKDNK